MLPPNGWKTGWADGFRLNLIRGSSVVAAGPACQAGRRRRSARSELGGKRLAIRVAEQIAGELSERALVHVALESDHRIKRDPVVVPPPGIEFRALGSPQAHVALAADQPEQKPDLLLPAVVAAAVALEPALGNLVAQPVARAPQDLDVRGQQAHLLLQLPVHGLHRRLP